MMKLILRGQPFIVHIGTNANEQLISDMLSAIMAILKGIFESPLDKGIKLCYNSD